MLPRKILKIYCSGLAEITFLDISNLIPENRRQERSLIEIALIFFQEHFWGEASAPPPQ